MAIFDSRDEECEGGAAALTLLVTAIVVSLGIIFYMVLPLATAGDRKAANRTAADAAALAGADWVLNDLGTLLTTQGWLGSWGDYQRLIGDSTPAAQTYAQRNGGTLVEYRFDFGRWEAWAKVESPQVRDAGKPVSEATARLEFPDCTSRPSDDPTTPPPADEDPPPPADEDPPPPDMTLNCDGLDVTLVPVVGSDPIRYELSDLAISGLLDLVTTRLVN